ncbi:ankyrin repeat-containing protein BDA1-like [Chenopodium quinoa]|uniref:ankyrin repeat-containing protein BDA1-like n=1 Tax=Chenopodium quinoa TaxID=63459 RepID=UPI000B782263|nr:ankyrin repeat-containing protein BDA1-like [Chenopodium quinoa]
MGNTPLHVALIHYNVKVAKFLLEKDSYLAQIVNNSKEAPLHLAIKQLVNYSESKSIMARVRKPINSAHQEDINDMIEVIKLVEKASFVTCWPDAKGLTPLHQVASLSSPHNIELTNFILDNCGQSAEVCDASGKSILHLLIDKIPNYQVIDETLFSRREMYALRNHQDHQGNTPLHIAAKNKDINMVRFLLKSSPNLNVNNIEGTSAAFVIHQLDVLQDEIDEADRVDITILRKRMNNLGKDFLLSKDSKGKNILHGIMVIKKESYVKIHEFVSFVEQALEWEPSLISQKDSKGDTPIHVLVRNHPDTKVFTGDEYVVTSSLRQSELLSLLLKKCNQCICKSEAIGKKTVGLDSPWLLQNVEGNTALHEALKSNNDNIDLVKLLLMYDKNSVNVVCW